MITSSPPRVVQSPSLGNRIRSSLMENQPASKVHLHYNHTDSCKLSRWNARESYQYMYERPWHHVIDFYSDVVKGVLPFSALVTNEASIVKAHDDQMDGGLAESFVEAEIKSSGVKDKRDGRWERVTYKIILSYGGDYFDGWQKQPGLKTVQGLIETSLGKFVDEDKAKLLKSKGAPIEGCAHVAGRTDKGVSAIQQSHPTPRLTMTLNSLLNSLADTWRKDVSTQDIEDAINSAEPGSLRAISVSKVSRAFHPNFSAKWRRYLYIFPLNDESMGKQSNGSETVIEKLLTNQNHMDNGTKCAKPASNEDSDKFIIEDTDVDVSTSKPTSFSIGRVNQLLSQLEGKLLSYRMFARDTKASRNVGPPTECFLYHARAVEARLPKDGGDGARVMCIELVANRFLRRMVRVLVSTTIREAAAGAEDDALLKLMDATCRRATAPPAPPDGLCLVNVGYAEFDPQSCLIR